MADMLLKDGEDSYKDIQISNGDIAICDDDSDVIQQAMDSIRTKVKEIPFHPTYGNRSLGNRMKYTKTYTDIIKDGCTNAILLDQRVSEVSEIEVNLDEEDRADAFVYFKVVTIDGKELSSTCGVELR